MISLSADPVIKLPEEKRKGGEEEARGAEEVRRRGREKRRGREDGRTPVCGGGGTDSPAPKAPDSSLLGASGPEGLARLPAILPSRCPLAGGPRRIAHLVPFCVRRQNVIRPMGVRPDGTLAPLEETLQAPEDRSGSDSD